VLAVTSERAMVLCVYPVALIASMTTATVSSFTKRVPLITCDTVETDTPALPATSAMVATGVILLVSRSLRKRSRKRLRKRLRSPNVQPQEQSRNSTPDRIAAQRCRRAGVK
jgi:hypothetical protein